MSAVQGKKREIRDYEKKVGLFEANVVSINPSREDLERLLSIPELEKDPEYLKEDEDGSQTLVVSVWLKELMEGQLFNVKFFLKDSYRTNKNGDKHQYLNTAGVTSWADEPENLPSWFGEGGREYRKAHVGEEELYTFLRSWLNQLDTRDVDAKLDFDWAKLMKGNVKELRDMMGDPELPTNYTGSLIALATVKTSKDGEKEYQQVYNRDFLPGYQMKNFRLAGKKKPKTVEKFVERIEDPEYGCKEFYGTTLGLLTTYNPEENIANGPNDISDDGPDLN